MSRSTRSLRRALTGAKSLEQDGHSYLFSCACYQLSVDQVDEFWIRDNLVDKLRHGRSERIGDVLAGRVRRPARVERVADFDGVTLL